MQVFVESEMQKTCFPDFWGPFIIFIINNGRYLDEWDPCVIILNQIFR